MRAPLLTKETCVGRYGLQHVDNQVLTADIVVGDQIVTTSFRAAIDRRAETRTEQIAGFYSGSGCVVKQFVV